jgi:hypothetical protein
VFVPAGYGLGWDRAVKLEPDGYAQVERARELDRMYRALSPGAQREVVAWLRAHRLMDRF